MQHSKLPTIAPDSLHLSRQEILAILDKYTLAKPKHDDFELLSYILENTDFASLSFFFIWCAIYYMCAKSRFCIPWYAHKDSYEYYIKKERRTFFIFIVPTIAMISVIPDVTYEIKNAVGYIIIFSCVVIARILGKRIQF